MMLLMPENRARVTYLQVLRGRLSTARGAFSASTLTALRIAFVQTPTCLATSRSVPGRPGWHLKSSHRVRRYVQIRPKTFPLYGVNRGPPHHPCFCSITRDLNTRDGKHELPLCSCSGRRRRNYRFGRVGPLLELAYISENPREGQGQTGRGRRVFSYPINVPPMAGTVCDGGESRYITRTGVGSAAHC